MTRRLTGDEKLIRAIARAIKRASCANTAIVESLMSTAAGIATDRRTHDCREFRRLAHDMYHSAEDVIEQREVVIEGAGGFQN